MGEIKLTEADERIIELAFNEPEAVTGVNWPEPLRDEAYHGLVGDYVRKVEQHTEADPVAILVSFLTLFGNAIGRSAHFVAEADKHYCNLFSCMVGATAKGRKGVSIGIAKLPFKHNDEWMKDRFVQGMSSGEGLIWAVRDEVREVKLNKQGIEEEVITVNGVEDKRLMVIESEFASAIRVLRREGNTLSAVVRKARDDGNLQVLTKNSPARASDAHISILAHITKDELLRYLEDTETANGFGNRFLWVCVKRSRCLPEGGRLMEVDLSSEIARLKSAIHEAEGARELKRDESARQLWFDIYPELSEGMPGLTGSMLARAEAQVMRLACIYALLDEERVIRIEHLKAGLAVWKYCEDSARFIFGESHGDPIADELYKIIKGHDGITKTDIWQYFGRNKSASELNRNLTLLIERGSITSRKEKGSQGRTVEKWFVL